MSINEFSPIGIFFGLWSIAFSVVSIVMAFNNKNKIN